jgi:hypothetical protein
MLFPDRIEAQSSRTHPINLVATPLWGVDIARTQCPERRTAPWLQSSDIYEMGFRKILAGWQSRVEPLSSYGQRKLRLEFVPSPSSTRATPSFFSSPTRREVKP